MSTYLHSSQHQSKFRTTLARTVNVTLKTTLTSSQNRHPAETQGYAASFLAGGVAFFLRRSVYLRHTNGAARIKTRLNNQPNVSPLVIARCTTRRSRDPRVLRPG
jgi:hypothetical protein